MLKVGVIGIGEQAWDNILPSLSQIPAISTVAACDIDKSSTGRLFGAVVKPVQNLFG